MFTKKLRKFAAQMGKSDTYKIDLKGMIHPVEEYHYTLTDQFFTDVDAPDVHKGTLESRVVVHKLGHDGFEISFFTTGTVVVACNRCLGDMNQPIEAEGHTKVRFGEVYSDEDDELITVPERDGQIDMGWLIYESIVLAIPIKHVHATGECDPAMMACLQEHQAVPEVGNGSDADDQEEDEPAGDTPIDPRWEKLKKIKNNDLKI